MSPERVRMVPGPVVSRETPGHEALRRAPEYDQGESNPGYVSVRHEGTLDDCRAEECRALRREVIRRAGG